MQNGMPIRWHPMVDQNAEACTLTGRGEATDGKAGRRWNRNVQQLHRHRFMIYFAPTIPNDAFSIKNERVTEQGADRWKYAKQRHGYGVFEQALKKVEPPRYYW